MARITLPAPISAMKWHHDWSMASRRRAIFNVITSAGASLRMSARLAGNLRASTSVWNEEIFMRRSHFKWPEAVIILDNEMILTRSPITLVEIIRTRFRAINHSTSLRPHIYYCSWNNVRHLRAVNHERRGVIRGAAILNSMILLTPILQKLAHVKLKCRIFSRQASMRCHHGAPRSHHYRIIHSPAYRELIGSLNFFR